MHVWPLIHFGFAVGSFAIALLVVTPAPTVPIFKLSVGATEFGHWLALGPVLLLAVGPWSGWLGVAGTLLALAAVGLFLSSAVRAQRLARKVPAELTAAFGAGATGESPFFWRRLWFAPSVRPVKVEVREFAEHGGEKLELHFFRSQQAGQAPCVIAIHGGGWEGGTPDEFVACNHRLAAHGYAVAAVQYRFAPRSPWPAQREDVLAALRFLQSHADELGLAADKFVLLGRSAGGQIAKAVAYSANDPAIRGCIAFYAPADMRFAHEFATDDDIISSLGLVLRYMGGAPIDLPESYDSASGIRLAARTSPPTLLLHGRRDPYVWYLQSRRLAARLREVGAPHYFLDLPWATHGFDFNPHGPGGQLSAYAIERFLAAVTR